MVSKRVLSSWIVVCLAMSGALLAQSQATTGVIEGLRQQLTDTSSVTRPYNLAVQDDWGVEFTFNYEPMKNWRVNGNANFFRSETGATPARFVDTLAVSTDPGEAHWGRDGFETLMLETWAKAQGPVEALRRGATVDDVARLVHKEFAAALKYARRWPKGGGGVSQVGRDHPVEDGDLPELHT